jgi:hypothetical protein
MFLDWYINKNNLYKKYYFNIFLNKKYFKNNHYHAIKCYFNPSVLCEKMLIGRQDLYKKNLELLSVLVRNKPYVYKYI